MNKIYKVIWSKVRNCYVAVSEIAKRNGKSCTSVNCGAKANRGHAGMALAIALSVTGGAVFTMPQVAMAADIVITSGSETINDATHAAGDYYLNGSNITFTVNEGGVVNSISGNSDAAVSGNTVTINGGTVNNAGNSWIEYPAGSGNWVGKPNLTGGFSTSGAVIGNQVSITNATLSGSKPTAYGGYSQTGNVSKNPVTFEGGVNEELYIKGGFSVTGVVGGDTAADGNIVTIKSGTVYFVAGGEADMGSAKNNQVSVSGGTVGAEVYGGYVDDGGTGDASNNVVSISGSTTTVGGVVIGGQSYYGAPKENDVTISGATVNSYVYGGFARIANSETAIASGNQVTISEKDGNIAKVAGAVYGGRGSNATGNRVIVTGGEIGGAYGGEGGKSSGNTVEVSGNKTIVNGLIYGGAGYDATGNEVVISNGATVNGDIHGGRLFQYASGTATKNKVLITDSTVNNNVYGGYVDSNADASGNIVTITGSTLGANAHNIFGGYVSRGSGAANNNTITIGEGVNGGNSSVVIYGGFSNLSNTNNTVNLTGVSDLTGTSLLGSTGWHTGNELHIGRNVKYDSEGKVVTGTDGKPVYVSDENTVWQGKNGETVSNKVGKISNFNTIAIHSVKWDPGPDIAVLQTTGGINGIDELDITDMTIYGSVNTGGTMNLLRSGNNTIDGIKLKYNDEEAVSLVSNPVKLSGSSFTDKEILTGLLKFSGESNDTVSLSIDNKAIVYEIGESAVTGTTFNGTADWNTSATLYINSSYKFDANATTNLAGLKFSDTTVTEDPVGKTMTLISGNVKGAIASQPTSATIGVSLDKSNAILGGTASGAASISGTDLIYTMNSVALKSVTVNGAGDAAVPAGWTAPASGKIEVTAGSGYTAPTAATTILAGTSALKFTEANTNIAEAIKYKAGAAETESSATKGVTLAYTQSKGIKADGTNLVYAADSKKNVTTITLGTVNTKDPRDMSGTDFDFTNTAKVDASGLKLEIAQPVDTTKRTIPLVTNAANLKDNVAVDYGTGKENHTQDVDLTHEDTGIALNATVNGVVATKDKAVNYNVTGVTLNILKLDEWNGKSASEGLTGLKHIDGGVSVDTGSFAAPTDLAAGEARVIVTASSGFFDDTKITGANTYGEGDSFTETDQPGATLAGTKVGGVKAEDSGAKLTYYAMAKTGKNLALGEATFVADGRLASYGSAYDLTATDINADGLKFTGGTDAMKPNASMTVVDATGAKKGTGGATLASFASKTYEVEFADPIEGKALTLTGKHTDTLAQDTAKTKLTYTVGEKKVETAAFTGTVNWNPDAAHYENAGYTFSDATKIDASKLSMAGSVTTALAPGESMTLLSAAGLKETNSVTQPTAAGSINVAYETQGVDLHANASGEVKAATGAVKYEVTGVAVDTVNLAGWNGTSVTAPTSWTLATGAKVDTSGMTEPKVKAGAQVPVFTSGAMDFSGAAISGGNEYKEQTFDEADQGIRFAGKQSRGVKAESKDLVYVAGEKNVETATMKAEIPWSDGGAYYKNTEYTFNSESKIDISGVKFTADTDPLAGSTKGMILISNVDGAVTAGTPQFDVALQNTKLEATAAGTADIDSGGNLKYTVTGVTLDKVSVSGVGSDAVPEGWSVSPDVAVDTDSMTVPTDVGTGEEKAILTAKDTGTFTEDNIKGGNAYKTAAFTENSDPADASKGVTLKGRQGKGVTVAEEGKSLVYKVGKKETDTLALGAVDWKANDVLLDGSDKTKYDYVGVASVDAGGFAVNYAKDVPQTIAAGDSMTLLKANETLKAMVNEEKQHAYNYEPVSGVKIDANITGKLMNNGNNIVFTAAKNKASKLTFTNVAWNDSAPLMARPKNIIFSGADVDTSAINFYNLAYLDADQKMTLVSDFGDAIGVRTGDTYMVGTGFEGEGEALLDNGNLIYHTITEAGVSEQTHKTVMAGEAGLAVLAAGNDHLGKVLEGLGDMANVAPDGTTVSVSIGGGGNRYETGSHVNVNSWNAAVAVGAKRSVKGGSLEYGLFGEYGKGSYKLHSDAGTGDGDTHYAGAGLMGKWTNKHDVYTEASFRLGRMSDNSSDIMIDRHGNKYGYDVHANYFGAHVGVGKIFRYKGGKSLDVYGRYFYTKRDGVEFDAIQHYKLDSVKSSLLRIGARYGTTDKKWNWYGGLAYQYEFDGESTGTVNGAAIRAASIKGSSVRGEIGMKMNATKTNPWQVDVSLYGYGGKHRGFGGNVNVAYMF